MRPIKLHLTNFGPFLNETVDFTEVKDNQLFLISGKTGSGKTMIFDAVVYALFGEASTKDRKESDLRSHFAESKKPMVVEFEFKLRDQYFKIQRQGAFIKEGNKNKTLGQLAVYQYEGDDFALRESKINSGNLFIKELLGVNAEQFRQLFILPQGEFKRFLLSKSIEKQDILRTLFNSQRFEEIQKKLSDDVKEVREQIETRYNQLENHWKELETFDDGILNEHKLTNARQTNHIIKALPEFKAKGQTIRDNLKSQKDTLKTKLNTSETNLNENIKLEESLNKLQDNQQKYNELLVNEYEINKKIKRVKEINEVRPITNLLDAKDNINFKQDELTHKIKDKNEHINEIEEQLKQCHHELAKHKEIENDIGELRHFVEQTQLFFEKASKYKIAYTNCQSLNDAYTHLEKELANKNEQINHIKVELNDRHPDYQRIEQITNEIFDFNTKIKQLKQNEKDKFAFEALENRKNQKQIYLKELNIERKQLEEKSKRIDKSNLDLNNKKDIIATVQAALHTGDTCPICGNEIHTLSNHINFDEIIDRHEQLTQIEQKSATLKENQIKCESELAYINEQQSHYSLDALKDTNYKSLELDLDKKYEEKRNLEEENNKIVNLKEQLQQSEKNYHDLQMNIQKKSIV